MNARTRGLTRTDVLVTVTVIIIVSGVALPALETGRRQSQTKFSLNNLVVPDTARGAGTRPSDTTAIKSRTHTTRLS